MPVSIETVVRELRNLGVTTGATLMVHASLRKLRPHAGAIGLLEALREVVGAQGTLVMPLGAEPGAPFDKLHTPAEVDIGALAEVFRKHPGVRVNDHVAGRFGAWGPLADELLNPTPLNDYLGPGSLLERFTQRGGHVLRLGADTNTVTLTHYAEYLCRVPEKRRVRLRYERKDIGEQWIESLDDCEGIKDWDGEDYFSDLLTEFLATGQARQARIEGCPLELLPANAYVAFAVQWLEHHLA